MLFEFFALSKRDLQIYSLVDNNSKLVFLNEKKRPATLPCVEHANFSELELILNCLYTKFNEVRIMQNTHTYSISGVIL